ncbi:hypothetical protein [Tenacibaculum amylolyticum]|uniref:hypothetical protein n=1 Tax=Tenacibaculum amylolyticum TaxID=104269 RepID=UPI003894D968
MTNIFRKSPKLVATALFATALVFTSCQKNEELIDTPVEQNSFDGFNSQARTSNQEGFHYGFPIINVGNQQIIDIYEGNNRNADLTPVNLPNFSKVKTIRYDLDNAITDNSPGAEAHNWIPVISQVMRTYENALADLDVKFVYSPGASDIDLIFSYFNSGEFSPVSGRFPDSNGSVGRIININPLGAAYLNQSNLKQSKFNFMLRAFGQILGFSPTSAECELSFMTSSVNAITNSTRSSKTLTSEESLSLAKRLKLLYVYDNLSSFNVPPFVSFSDTIVTRGYQSCPDARDSSTVDTALNDAEVLYNRAFNIQ